MSSQKCFTLSGSQKSNCKTEQAACLLTMWSMPKASKPSMRRDAPSLPLPQNISTTTTSLRGRCANCTWAASSKLDLSAAAPETCGAGGMHHQELECCCKLRGFKHPGSAQRCSPLAHFPPALASLHPHGRLNPQQSRWPLGVWCNFPTSSRGTENKLTAP